MTELADECFGVDDIGESIGTTDISAWITDANLSRALSCFGGGGVDGDKKSVVSTPVAVATSSLSANRFLVDVVFSGVGREDLNPAYLLGEVTLGSGLDEGLLSFGFVWDCINFSWKTNLAVKAIFSVIKKKFYYVNFFSFVMHIILVLFSYLIQCYHFIYLKCLLFNFCFETFDLVGVVARDFFRALFLRLKLGSQIAKFIVAAL